MTEFSTQTHIMLIFLLPLLAALCSVALRFANVRDALSVLIAALACINIVKVLGIFLAGGYWLSVDLLMFAPGLPLTVTLEPLGMMFAVVVTFLWLASTLYSIGYMRGNNESHQHRFFGFFSLSIGATLGIAFSGNLLTLFVFYELLTLLTLPLVMHSGTDDARKAGRVYMGMLLGTSILLLLPAILLTWHVAGTLDFTKGGILASTSSVPVASLLLFLYVYGIGKAALMPMHRWLPTAMVAPAPVSALLHAVAVVKAGVFSIVKIVIYIFGVDYLHDLMQMEWWNGAWLMYASGITIVVASLIALNQDDLKKRLAYSTVSQLSYVVMALSMVNPPAITGAAFHIVAHAFAKITLFFAAGAIYTAAHKTKVSQLAGIGRKMPWTMTAFAVASLSMIGIPPTVGFLSKWYMLVGAWSEQIYFVIGVLALSTLLNAAYFLPIICKAFFQKDKTATGVMISRNHGEAPFSMVLALTVTAAATLGLFIYPWVFLDLAKELVK